MQSFRPITVCVTVREPGIRQLARYALHEAATRIGRPIRVVDGEPAAGAVVYGPVPESWRGGTLAYEPRCYDAAARFASVGSPPLWAPEGTDAAIVDLVGGLARLLTLLDETQVEEGARNSYGIFSTAALPPARAQMRSEPLVEHHAAALRDRLEALDGRLPPASPRWPSGRRYAVVVTHDTDAVALGTALEILFNGTKAILRRDPVRARMTWDGLTLKGDDPLFGFGKWAEVERALDLRSAFFLYGRGRVRPALHDCRSTVFNYSRVDWAGLRSLAAEGWEFGLHPPINAKDNIDEFIWGKEALEEKLGRPIWGLRHHYWALDWRRPHLTFRKHVNAGFRYDSSIAWQDEAGYRAGTCLPYRPYDPGRGRALDLYELPTTVMDWHVIDGETEIDAAVERALRIAEGVRAVGGVVMLDWHTEASSDAYCYRNLRTALTRFLRALRADPEAWFTTPWELTRRWHERRRSLQLEEVMA
jgi:peptidoglycan/xylan/chitin deacetylase (PgdA/CDA1 family)